MFPIGTIFISGFRHLGIAAILVVHLLIEEQIVQERGWRIAGLLLGLKIFLKQISINTEILRNTTTSTSETLPVQEIPYTFV